MLNLEMIGLICLGRCRRGLQNEILASHFEMHLNEMCTRTLQGLTWHMIIGHTTGQPGLGPSPSEWTEKLLLASETSKGRCVPGLL